MTLLQSELLDITTNVGHAFGWSDLGVPTAAFAPVAAGMVMGRKVGDKIPGQAFKKTVFVVVLLSGAELVRKAIFA